MSARVHVARSIEDAAAALVGTGEDSARLLAGGTWVMRAPIRREDLAASYVAIGRIEALRALEADDQEVRIGACATHADIAEFLQALPEFEGLRAAADNSANPAVRNMATIGGNICTADFAASDFSSALLSLDASVDVATTTGEGRLSFAEFLLGARGAKSVRDPGRYSPVSLALGTCAPTAAEGGRLSGRHRQRLGEHRRRRNVAVTRVSPSARSSRSRNAGRRLNRPSSERACKRKPSRSWRANSAATSSAVRASRRQAGIESKCCRASSGKRSAILQRRRAMIEGRGSKPTRLSVNGEERWADAAPLTPLIDVLRDTFALTGAKAVCREGFLRRLHGFPRRAASRLLPHAARVSARLRDPDH